MRRCTGDPGEGSKRPAGAKRQKHEAEHFYSFICLGWGLTHVNWENLRRLHGEAGVQFKACCEAHQVICVQRWNFDLFGSWLARSENGIGLERFTQNQYGFVVMR